MDEIKNIRKGDITAFEALFHQYYPKLYQQAFHLIGQREVAEELVQDVFIKIWERRAQLLINTSVNAYLSTAVRHSCFNYVKSKMAQQSNNLAIESLPFEPATDNPDDTTQGEELKYIVEKALKELPEKCHLIFTLSRQAGLTYQEIADELGVSKETVKSQIKIALHKLRTFVAEYGYLLLFIPLFL